MTGNSTDSLRTVFLFVPNFVFTTDFLYTQYIDYLASKYRVVVFSPVLDEKWVVEGGYFQSPNVSYIGYSLENPHFWRIFKLLRISMIGEFDHLPSMRHFYRRTNYRTNWKRRFLRFLSRPFSWILTANFFTRVEAMLLPRLRKLKEYYRLYNPALVITATPGLDPHEAEAIIFSKRKNIPTVAVDFSWDNLTLNCKHIRKTDYLIAWTDVNKKEAIEIHHYDPNRVFVGGVLKFDHYFSRQPGDPDRPAFLIGKGLDPKKKTLVFGTKPRVYTEQLNHLRFLLEARDRGRFVTPLNFLVRLHPLDSLANYSSFSGFKDVCIEEAGRRTLAFSGGRKQAEMTANDLLNLKSTLRHGDVFVLYGSTLALEAAIFDKPVVDVGFMGTQLHSEGYFNPHYLPILQSGAVRLAKSLEELVDFINEYLRDPDRDSKNRVDLVSRYFPVRDGLAYRRSVDFLEKII